MGETREIQDDAEITLGTGKLLGIFFALTVICAVFFIVGYMLGRASAAGAKTEIVGTIPSGNGPANKPSASNIKAPDASSQNCVAGSSNCPLAVSNPDASKPTLDHTQPQPANPAIATPSVQPATNVPSSNAATETKNASGSSYIVQVAAVSKQEDAEFLV